MTPSPNLQTYAKGEGRRDSPDPGRYTGRKIIAPRPGDLILTHPSDRRVEIRRVYLRDGPGWRILDSAGHVRTVAISGTRGIWITIPSAGKPIE